MVAQVAAGGRRSLRLAVIGAGSWTVAAHLPALRSRPEVEFAAVNRLDPGPLAKIKDDWGFQVASEDYREVLAQAPDIVVVASPSGFHHEHAKAALESGAHVLCEKPMTVEPAQAWDLVETAARVGRQLLISFGWSYMPLVRQFVRLLDEHPIGEPEHLTIHMSSATRELLSNAGAYPDAAPEAVPEQSTWTDPAVSGGGYAQAQLSHALGLALTLVPVAVTEVFAFGSAPLGAPVELHDAAALRLANGAVGVLSGGSNHRGASANKHELEVRAIGSEGQLILDVHRELAWIYRPDRGDFHVRLPEGSGGYQPQGPANALVDVALGDLSANAAPGELGARTVDALSLLYRSLETGSVARAVSPRREG
jgi:predicted dehydrogenase